MVYIIISQPFRIKKFRMLLTISFKNDVSEDFEKDIFPTLSPVPKAFLVSDKKRRGTEVITSLRTGGRKAQKEDAIQQLHV